MRNAILGLLVLAAALGLWWVYDREPNLSAGQAELDAQREAARAAAAAEAEAIPDAELPQAASDPYETVDDPEYVAARTERDRRLEEIRKETERRRAEDGFLGGGGDGTGNRVATDEPDTVLEEPEPNLDDLASLTEEAARRAEELDLVPPELLEGLSPQERLIVLRNYYLWHQMLVAKHGPGYTPEQQNLSAIILNVLQGASEAEILRWLREHV